MGSNNKEGKCFQLISKMESNLEMITCVLKISFDSGL
jgi:hypothetical protein